MSVLHQGTQNISFGKIIILQIIWIFLISRCKTDILDFVKCFGVGKTDGMDS